MRSLVRKNKAYDEDSARMAYALEVEKLIRKKYKIGAELAILRQRDEHPEEFDEYYAYAEECKRIAREKFGM